MSEMRLPDPCRPEAEVAAACLRALQPGSTGARGALDWPRAAHQASAWVQAHRDHPPPFWALESLLREYPISGPEGVALMRLAEALLRVPDEATALELLRDQLEAGDFLHHTRDAGSARSWMARLSAGAVALGQHWLHGGPDFNPALLARLGAQGVLAATLRAVQLLGRQFVLGQDLPEALRAARRLRASTPAPLTFSFDMLGEGARSDAEAARYLQRYRDALQGLARGGAPAGLQGAERVLRRDGLSVKLSALHPRYEEAQRARLLRELLPRVLELAMQAAHADLPLTLDAEESERLELSLELFEAVLAEVARQVPQWLGFGLAVQAYQTRAPEQVQHLIAMARRHHVRLFCRLVKGAYWDAEIKRAQELGLSHYPVFTHKAHSDLSYLACARALLDAPDAVLPAFAGHNAGTLAAVLQMAGDADVPFELQRLHGMGEGVYRELLRQQRAPCRVYAPVGEHRDLLAYLVRRLLENGANASFVHQLADPTVGMNRLLASPLQVQTPSGLTSPERLFAPPPPGPGAAMEAVAPPWRRNSLGLDLAVATHRQRLQQALDTSLRDHPTLTVGDTPPASLPELLASAREAWPAWCDSTPAHRAQVLLRAADRLQDALPRMAGLLVREARKTWSDAVAEVREAIDFLRYYAMECERLLASLELPGVTGESNRLRLRGKGSWVCISPWNFPLAIFTGQLAAALAAGNAVLAKPAEQTPFIASEMLRLLHGSGVPREVLQGVYGPGETVGAALVAQPGLAGVAFTGSTEVARLIQRSLAAQDGPLVPLLAETGGINAMVVDSTALPEQVCDAVLQSAYRSAGQRCSALRLLCVQDEVADAMIEMIAGAARELVLGDPADFATDVGPLIDAPAWQRVQAQLQGLRATARDRLAWGPVPAEPAYLMAPQLFEITEVAQAREEIFGPVLQVVRWRGDPLRVVDQINALGFGLTLGIQTRIDGRAQALAARARVGNVYVNRNMVGAVVGVQPFGGEGLSGTGPKAGGPHYLARFVVEQTLSVNTAAAGGNAALLARPE